jgi:heterodisulfide reductase subunit C
MVLNEMNISDAAESGEHLSALEKAGAPINACYQCKTCTLGCPMAFKMDIMPHQVLRLLQLGRRDDVLRSVTIWKCVSCEACYTRCPNGINIPLLMDAMRQAALAEKKASRRVTNPVFNRIFLDGIRKNGVLFELGLMIRLKLATMDFFSDTIMGARMMLRGKLSFRPHKIKESGAMEYIFKKAGKD